MGTRIRAVLSVGAIAVCVGLAASACSSGSTAGVDAASSSASASPAFPVESLPPGVQKDSVQDLNSTKNMTGVVTTLPANQSPYIDHLPDVCSFVDSDQMRRLNLRTKKLAFKGTRLVGQACSLQGFDASGNLQATILLGFYTDNIQQITAPERAVVIALDVPITQNISGIKSKLPPTSPDDPTFMDSCSTSWGTFFGAITVDFNRGEGSSVDPCSASTDAARVLVGTMPRSPSQMRPAQ